MTHNPTQGYLDMELLRFTTAGSVDDGKSTLIGRLLYDSKAIFEDQMEAVRNYSLRKGNQDLDLSLFTDGLRSEREQGITIDVAYRYFATPRRKFIIADTPGHIQYTRNMVTGASTANAAIVLIDARNGITEQTRRHCFIASLLRIPYLIVCVNKMDLVGFDQKVYDEILADFNLLRSRFSFNDITFVPISALQGDNVVEKSGMMSWYQGSTLLDILETLDIQTGLNYTDARFPVQYVIRPHDDSFHDYRSYAGRVEGGVFKPGDNIVVLPSGLTSTIESIDVFQGSLPEAFPPQSVSFRLADDIDISRGDVISKADSLPQISQEIDVMMCWMNLRPMKLGGTYVLRQTTREVKCIVKELYHKIDINTLEPGTDINNLAANEIGLVKLKVAKPLVYDAYSRNRQTGSVILVDEGTNETVGVGMIIG